MLPEKKTRTNIGVGIGVLLQLVGLFLAQSMVTYSILGIILILMSIPVLIWGCMNYAEGKGHSKWVGLVALAGVIGLVVMVILPTRDRDGSVHRLQLRKLVGLISLVLGFVLVVLGRWLDDLAYAGDAGRLVRLLHPWWGVCIFLGVCLVVASLVFILGNGSR